VVKKTERWPEPLLAATEAKPVITDYKRKIASQQITNIVGVIALEIAIARWVKKKWMVITSLIEMDGHHFTH